MVEQKIEQKRRIREGRRREGEETKEDGKRR